MSDTNKYSTLPDNADNVLFAEDFVNHILLNHKLPLLSSGIADHRDFIYNAFNPQVGIAANHVANELHDEMFDEFAHLILQDIRDISAFTKYAIPFRLRTLEIMLPIEFGANIFLQFCVKISTMAVEFYNITFLEAPGLAVEYIINILDGINMIDEGGWKALHLVAAQHFINTADNYLSPEPASDSNLLISETEYRTTDFMSSSSSSGEEADSEGSRSPDHEMNERDNKDKHPEKLTDDYFCTVCITAMCTSSEGQVSSSSVCKHVEKTEASRLPDQEMNSVDNLNELPEKLTDGDFCKMCITAMSTSSEGQASSILVCKHVQETIDVVSENIASFFDNTSDSVPFGASEGNNSEDSFHSFEGTSSEEDTSKQNKRKKLKKKPSFLHSKDSDSDS